ncbi:hypothetical protein SH528x_005587 [Novipirellula sp. SH528]|uniref:hypothetical protein n=1 Tax=Novipirellula sp. SH528 TaxID=3454466 RepID=UPI003FA0CEB1
MSRPSFRATAIFSLLVVLSSASVAHATHIRSTVERRQHANRGFFVSTHHYTHRYQPAATPWQSNASRFGTVSPTTNGIPTTTSLQTVTPSR